MRAVSELSPLLQCFTVASGTEPQAGLLAAASPQPLMHGRCEERGPGFFLPHVSSCTSLAFPPLGSAG